MGFSATPNGATNKFFSAIDQHSFHAPSVGDGLPPWKDPSQNNKDFTPTLRRTRLGSDVSRKTSAADRKAGSFQVSGNLLPLSMAGYRALLENAYRANTFMLNRTR